MHYRLKTAELVSYLKDCEVHLTKCNDLGLLLSGQNHTSTHDEHAYGH